MSRSEANPRVGINRQRLAVLIGLAGFVFVGILFAQLLRYLIGAEGGFSRGQVAPFDVRAPYRLTFVSEVETNRQRDLAEASVAPVFTPPDAQVSRQQVNLLNEVLDRIRAIRADPELSDEQRVARLLQLREAYLSEAVARRIVSLNDTQWSRVAAQSIAVMDVVMRNAIHLDNLNKTRASIGQYISLSLSSEEAELVTQLVAPLIVPNTNYDAQATEAARRAAREAVKPVERTYEANQVIVRNGQVIGALEIEALEKFNLQRPQLTVPMVLSVTLLSLVATAILALGAAHIAPSLLRRPLRNVALSAAAFVLTLVLSRWLLPAHGTLPYLAPIAALPILVASWMGSLPAVAAALICGSVIGLGMERTSEVAASFVAGGIVATLTLGSGKSLGSFLRAGVLAGFTQAAVVVAFQLPQVSPAQLLTPIALSLAGGLIAAGLAVALLFIAGALLDVTTTIQINELARLSHPLMQMMVVKAPGTYHHSLMVANLAEQAAERIGADALLTRVGAYFHDIGKMANPHFFIENQLDQYNPHDQLDPQTSSAILRSHVTEGLKMAAKYRLPQRIRDFIAEHHGTTRTNYQYALAVKAQGPEVDPQDFRYAGPKPRSKETALVMLADGCEAAVRSARCSTLEEMDRVIRQVFSERLADHQLDDSDLTLREIEVARQSFLETLRGAYHPRIRYPVQAASAQALPDSTQSDDAWPALLEETSPR